ncbi:MAG: nicotinic acid mononucleotide adenylyltransferase, partial [Paracoccaceae bacterium]
DNLARFHRWEDWRGIIETIPVGVLGRPDDVVRAALSPAARAYAHARLETGQSRALAWHRAPVWCLVSGPMVDLSSSEIRKNGDWGEKGFRSPSGRG